MGREEYLLKGLYMFLWPVTEVHEAQHGVLSNIHLPPCEVGFLDDIARCLERGDWLKHDEVIIFVMP